MNMSPYQKVLQHFVKRISVIIAMLATSASAAHAQVVFAPPQNVSNGPAGQSGQQMLVDSQGDIYVAWIGGAPGCTICFSRSTDRGVTFSSPATIHTGGTLGFAMVLDSSDNVYLAWAVSSSGPGGFSGILITRSSDRGATFSPPATVTNMPAGSPQLATEPSGKIDVLWISITGSHTIQPCSDCPPETTFDHAAFFSQSVDGGSTFSPRTAVFSTQGDQGQGPSAQIAVGSGGQVFVLGQETGFVELARSNDSGATFSITNIENSSIAALQPKMVLDAGGNIDVVWPAWNNRYHTFFSRSTDLGVAFSTPMDLTPTSLGVDDPKIAVDSGGNIYIVWLDFSPGYDAVFFSRSTDGGTTFSSPVALSTDPSLGYGLGPDSTAIAVGPGGNVSVVWEDNDSANRYQNPYQSTQWDIYLANSDDGGATFQAPVNVSHASAISASPLIAVDASSTYVSWMQSPPSPFNFNVFFSRGAVLSLSSVSLSSTSVTGGSSSTSTVTLSGPAPAGGVVVSLTSSDPSVSVPGTATIAAGTTSTTFTVTTNPVAAQTNVAISAVFSGVTQTATMTVEPPALTSLGLNPSSTTGGSSSTGTVTLSGPAPAGGAVVALSSSNSSLATVPPSITVPAGFRNATFTVNTSRLLCPKSAAIAASFNAVSQTTNLAVMPFVNLPAQACSAIGAHGPTTVGKP